jgi:hypothetical protein
MPTVEKIEGLKINAPEFFRDVRFLAWLNNTIPGQTRPTTWHEPGSEAGEYSDVFINFDHGCSADDQHLPGDIFEQLCRIADEHGMTYGVFWVTNT